MTKHDSSVSKLLFVGLIYSVLAGYFVYMAFVFKPAVTTKYNDSDTGYLVTSLQNNDVVVCMDVEEKECGIQAIRCEDGVDRLCLTDVTVRIVEP